MTPNLAEVPAIQFAPSIRRPTVKFIKYLILNTTPCRHLSLIQNIRNNSHSKLTSTILHKKIMMA